MNTRHWSRKSLVLLCASVAGAATLAVAPAFGRDRVETLLQSLADAPGPSGYEEEVRAIMVRELKPFATQISYDGLGSVIAQHGSKGPRIKTKSSTTFFSSLFPGNPHFGADLQRRICFIGSPKHRYFVQIVRGRTMNNFPVADCDGCAARPPTRREPPLRLNWHFKLRNKFCSLATSRATLSISTESVKRLANLSSLSKMFRDPSGTIDRRNSTGTSRPWR